MNLTDLKALQQQPDGGPKLAYKVADSFATAPGYREMDVVYSCVPDPAYPWDPQVMKAIREFAPDAVPMWIQWAFMSPHETGNPEVVVFGRHALGRTIQNLTSELEPFRCAMPTMPCQGLTFERPNRIWFVHEGAPNQQYPDLPGSYLPFDGSILDRAKKSAIGFKMSEKEFIEHMKAEFIEKAREEKERRRTELENDLEAREKDFAAYADKQFERISEVEASEFQRAAGLRDKRARPTIVVP
jgi:hypothetical protein